MKNLLIILTTLLLFIVTTNKVYGATTGWKTATANDNGGCADDLTKLNALDNDPTVLSTSSCQNYLRDFNFNIPDGAEVTGIEVKGVAKRSGTSTTTVRVNLMPFFSSGGLDFDNMTNGCLAPADAYFPAADNCSGTGNSLLTTSYVEYIAYDYHFANGHNQHTWVAEDFDNSNFRLRVQPAMTSFTGRSIELDYIAVRVTYGVDFYLNNATVDFVDATNGNAYMNLTGILGEHACNPDETCQLSLFEACESTSSASLNERVVFTGDISNHDENFCSPDNNDYDFDVIVPYQSASNCEYRTNVVCSESGTVTYNATSQIDTPSELQNLPQPEAPVFDDPFSWLAWRIGEILKGLFMPSGQYTFMFAQTKDLLEEKAPFGYVAPVYDISTSYSENNDTDLGSFTVSAGGINDLELAVDVEQIDGLSTALKATIATFIWVTFIFYLLTFIKTHSL